MTALARPSGPFRDLSSRGRAVVVTVVVLLLLALSAVVGQGLLRQNGAASSQGASYGGAPETARDSAGSDVGASSADGSVAPSDSAAKGGAGAAPGVSPGAAPGVTTPVVGAKLARSAWLGVRVADLTAATGRARLVATGAGGRVTSENVVTALDPTGSYRDTTSGRSAEDRAIPPVGVDEARMTLSVPEQKLDGVITEIGRLGTVAYSSSQSQDVTDSYVDTKARIEPAKDSIDQVRRLLAQAKDLQQIILLEQELNRRQADLDSLTQRLAELDRRTTMSDVTVTMWTSDTTPVDPASDDGFLGSLRTAWDGFLGSIAVILTGLAALLPWLVLLGLAAWVWLRVRRRRAEAAGSSAPSPTGPSETASPALVPASAGAATSPAATTPTPPPTAPPTASGRTDD